MSQANLEASSLFALGGHDGLAATIPRRYHEILFVFCISGLAQEPAGGLLSPPLISGTARAGMRKDSTALGGWVAWVDCHWRTHAKGGLGQVEFCFSL